MKLAGKVIMITGAGTGIGRALAVEVSRRGAKCILVGRRAGPLEETRRSLAAPDEARILAADVADQASRTGLVAAVVALGRLDVLVNNAGVVETGPLYADGASGRRRMIETNLVAPMELTLALLPLLAASSTGRVVNVGSMFGDIAFPYFSAYSATKFGLRGWSEALRREVGAMGVGVTYVAPRGTDTPAADGFADLAEAFGMTLDPPERVARQIAQAIEGEARDVYPKGPERLFLLIQRLMPKIIDSALRKQARKAAARLTFGALVLGALAAAPAMAADPGARVNPDMGWYVAGKGGPSLEQLSGVTAASGRQVNGDHSQNVIGAFGMAAGYEWVYRYGIPLRTEFEFMNRTELTYDASPLQLGGASGALASTVQNVTGMAKAYWHFPVGSRNWWPFVSGGLGWSSNTVKSQYTPSSGTAIRNTHATNDLAWSGGIGATFKLGPQVMNDVEIRYVNLGKADWGLPGSVNVAANGLGDLSATEVNFAIRVMF